MDNGQQRVLPADEDDLCWRVCRKAARLRAKRAQLLGSGSEGQDGAGAGGGGGGMSQTQRKALLCKFMVDYMKFKAMQNRFNALKQAKKARQRRNVQALSGGASSKNTGDYIQWRKQTQQTLYTPYSDDEDDHAAPTANLSDQSRESESRDAQDELRDCLGESHPRACQDDSSNTTANASTYASDDDDGAKPDENAPKRRRRGGLKIMLSSGHFHQQPPPCSAAAQDGPVPDTDQAATPKPAPAQQSRIMARHRFRFWASSSANCSQAAFHRLIPYTAAPPDISPTSAFVFSIQNMREEVPQVHQERPHATNRSLQEHRIPTEDLPLTGQSSTSTGADETFTRISDPDPLAGSTVKSGRSQVRVVDVDMRANVPDHVQCSFMVSPARRKTNIPMESPTKIARTDFDLRPIAGGVSRADLQQDPLNHSYSAEHTNQEQRSLAYFDLPQPSLNLPATIGMLQRESAVSRDRFATSHLVLPSTNSALGATDSVTTGGQFGKGYYSRSELEITDAAPDTQKNLGGVSTSVHSRITNRDGTGEEIQIEQFVPHPQNSVPRVTTTYSGQSPIILLEAQGGTVEVNEKDNALHSEEGYPNHFEEEYDDDFVDEYGDEEDMAL